MAKTHPITRPLTPGAPLAEIPQHFDGKKFFNANFTGANLKKMDMRGCTFMRCTFDKADLSECDCTGSEFYGSTFRETICRGTNFKDAKLHGTVFEPSDFYGMTMSFNCETFQGMMLSRPVWDGYMFFALGLMVPPKDGDGFDPRDAHIAAMGIDYYVEHFQKFKDRTL